MAEPDLVSSLSFMWPSCVASSQIASSGRPAWTTSKVKVHKGFMLGANSKESPSKRCFYVAVKVIDVSESIRLTISKLCAGMEIKMLRPKCKDSQRLVDWIEQGKMHKCRAPPSAPP